MRAGPIASIFFLAFTVIGSSATAAASAEQRCGWLANLTLLDLWLIDKDTTWIITSQEPGSKDADGLERVPEFSEDEFVATQGDHGYGCACLDVSTDPASERITEVFGGKILGLRQCRNDKSLPPL